jgi:hypothetical protein
LTPKQIITWLLRLAVIGLLVMLMVFGKLYCQSMSNYRQAEEHLNQDKLRPAMIAYEAVITNYTPLLNSQVEDAAQKLLEIGGRYEEADSLVLAFRAYQSLTSALTGIRSIYEPYPDLRRRGRSELDRVKEKIGEIDRLRWQAYEADTTSSANN